jgi:hypothetical protein
VCEGVTANMVGPKGDVTMAWRWWWRRRGQKEDSGDRHVDTIDSLGEEAELRGGR